MTDTVDLKRLVEAALFAAEEPLSEAELQAHLGGMAHVADVLSELSRDYAGRGIQLERHGRGWAFRTAPDLAPHLRTVRVQERRLPRAALETLAIIAYRQPVTRAEIEAVRGVAVAKGTIDLLLEQGWIVPRGRRDAPGRPVTWVTTEGFLDQFGLGSLDDLPRPDELESSSLLEVGTRA